MNSLNESVCSECGLTEGQVVLRVDSALICIPRRPHIAVSDGGHLIVVPARHVADRREILPSEAADIFIASLIAAEAMEAAFGTDWFNFQENGNWAVGDGRTPHMHLHVYGRALNSLVQPFGEALRFPNREALDGWVVPAPTAAEADSLVAAALRAYGSRIATREPAETGDDHV